MARRRTVSGVIVVGLVFVLTVALPACGGSSATENDTSAVKVTNGDHDPAENFQIILPVADAAMEASLQAEDPHRSVIPNGSEGYGPQRRLTAETATTAVDTGQGAVAYWPGPEVAGYPLTAVIREQYVDELPGMADPPVMEKVTFIYGTCEPSGPGRASCNVPIHVVTSGKRCPASAFPEFGNDQRRPPTHLPPVRGARVDALSGGVVAYVGERDVVVLIANATVARSVLAKFPNRTAADRALGVSDAGRAIVGQLRGVGRLTADVGPSTTFPRRPKSIGTYTAGDCPRSQSSFAK